MGTDAGFDMVPRLTKGPLDQRKWTTFIDALKRHYEDDDQVKERPNYLEFEAGEHPMIPFEGHKFLRLSYKVPGPNAARTGVENYIDMVASIAVVHFGARIRRWDETFGTFGHHRWRDVHASLRSYEQPDEPEIPTPITVVPGKGQRVIARFNIPEGTRILVEKPILTASTLWSASLERELASKLKALSKECQRQFFHLDDGSPCKHPLTGKFGANALPCGSESTVGGVYPTICFINHSCDPNSDSSWDKGEGHQTVHANRPITAGEEITISYGEPGPSIFRQGRLKLPFGFYCPCTACSAFPKNLGASEYRRQQVLRLDDAIGKPCRLDRDPAKALADCRSLIREIANGQSHGCVRTTAASIWYDAFQICAAHGDAARAAVFAERTYRERALSNGRDHPETVEMIRQMEGPAVYKNFGVCSMRWRTEKRSVLEIEGGIVEGEWLWRKE